MKSSEKNWSGIVVALISAGAAITVGYWQFGGKTDNDVSTFVGRVVDSKTEQRIRRAEVTLESSGAPPVVYTDSEGIFSFPLQNSEQPVRIRIEAEGYSNFDRLIVPSGNSGTEEIQLISTQNSDELTNTELNLRIEGPSSVPLGRVTYFSLISENAVRGVWTISGFQNEPVELNPLDPNHDIFIEPTDSERIGDSFIINFTAYNSADRASTVSKKFTLTTE